MPYRRESDEVATFGEVVHVGKHLAEPLRGGDDLIDTELAIMVAVHEREGTLVELKALHGTAEDGPKLLVELGEMGDVFATFDVHTGDTTHCAEFPVIPLFGDEILYLYHIIEIFINSVITGTQHVAWNTNVKCTFANICFFI